MPRGEKKADAGGNGVQQGSAPNKLEAVGRALDELGRGAMPADIIGFVRDRFGLTLTTKMASNYKSLLLKRGSKKKGKPGRRPRTEAALTAVRAGDGAIVSMDDLKAVKAL